ncbi:MAG TPA: AraC family transcriptional regulator [Oscillospiraceae bacterium]|nr:AraC family transcriptional regulator [Oscillospiraceae bacterium]HPF55823.1 AraC family transcriptional regulator [Clostridiales bacterium]HPK35111.1 AraC family transcriptional regulator [Oscillospiraceae bacterium]HPR75262.1 AraC family transcriptional regulator [Oscillospiraceae bacterium]
MQHVHYYLDQERNAFINPKLVFSGSLSVDRVWKGEKHAHDFCEIIYVLSGNGAAIIDGTKYAIKTNDILIYNPKVLHEEHSYSDEFNLVFFAVDNLKIPTLPDGCLISHEANPVIRVERKYSILKLMFQTLLEEINLKDTGYKAIATHLASCIVFYILRLMNMSTVNNEITERIKKTRDYINENYMNEINLDQLAASVYLSKFYYMHMFKEFFSVSPIKYQSNVRLQKAKELLLSTDLSIAEISEKVGYNNYVTFLRAFKIKENILPKKYRLDNCN